MADENSTLAVLTGSTGANPLTETTPVKDATARAAWALVIIAPVVTGICQLAGLNEEDTFKVVAFCTGPGFIFALGLFDRFVAPRLK